MIGHDIDAADQLSETRREVAAKLRQAQAELELLRAVFDPDQTIARLENIIRVLNSPL
jgi:hypothetical protein